MTNQMRLSKVSYSTQKLCRDLLDLIGHHLNQKKSTERFLYMQDSSLNTTPITKFCYYVSYFILNGICTRHVHT